jgi:hypothetical protein
MDFGAARFGSAALLAQGERKSLATTAPRTTLAPDAKRLRPTKNMRKRDSLVTGIAPELQIFDHGLKCTTIRWIAQRARVFF